jgi:DNA ligase (NAD+)
MSKKEVTHDEYLKLCEEAWYHNKLYYVDHAPEISDEAFDRLLKRIEEIEKFHPEWVTPVSPTQRVGEALTQGFQTIAHRIPMLSLQNTYSRDELADFIKRMHKLLERKEIDFSVELKMDGVAVSVRYENGLFVQGITRGDGRRGDDVTTNIKTIPALPLKLYGKNVPDFLEVRGEVFMPRPAFKKLNETRERNNEPLWANPRNAAAGSLKLLDPREASVRHLNIVFYGIAEESSGKITSQYAAHSFLKSLGFPILHHHAKCQTLEEIWEFAEKIRNLRQDLPFDIDGIVVKVDNLQEQKLLGSTGKNPRWAVAYKFAAEQAQTKIHDITVQVGRTGILTPVAELEPVFLAGSTISRATLHNEDEIKRKDIRVGDTVYIEKGGDVIPKVVSVVHDLRPSHSKPWKMPAKCPNCGTLVVRVPDEVAVRCPNSENCTVQQMRRIIYFARKDAMDIDNMGIKVVEHLFERGFVKKPSDIYKLTERELSQLPGFKDKAIRNLLEGIEKSKNVTLARFILALGIAHIGEETAEVLAERAGDIETLSNMKVEQFTQIEGIGETVATAIVQFFSDEGNRDEIQRLLALGISPK